VAPWFLKITSWLNFMQEQINEWIKVLTEKSNADVPLRTNPVTDRNIKYVLEHGRKYTKVVQEEYWSDKLTSKSVHAFIENSNGNIYKPASWKAPAKGARFNVVNDLETLLKVCDPFGSYLYKR
jgi:hypothetical protein